MRVEQRDELKEKYAAVFYPNLDPLPDQPFYPGCQCPWCRRHHAPAWPCGRPRRYWDTPIPLPMYAPPYDVNYRPMTVCGDVGEATPHGAMSGTGTTSLCN